MDNLNVDTLVLTLLFTLAASICFVIARRKKANRVRCISTGLLLSLIAIYWGTSTGLAWRYRVQGREFLLSAIAQMERGETPKISPYANKSQRDQILAIGPRIGSPPRSAVYTGSGYFHVRSTDGTSYSIQLNSHPPGTVFPLFRRPNFSVHDIDEWPS